jgi:hypothetical protein
MILKKRSMTRGVFLDNKFGKALIYYHNWISKCFEKWKEFITPTEQNLGQPTYSASQMYKTMPKKIPRHKSNLPNHCHGVCLTPEFLIAGTPPLFICSSWPHSSSLLVSSRGLEREGRVCNFVRFWCWTNMISVVQNTMSSCSTFIERRWGHLILPCQGHIVPSWGKQRCIPVMS